MYVWNDFPVHVIIFGFLGVYLQYIFNNSTLIGNLGVDLQC